MSPSPQAARGYPRGQGTHPSLYGYPLGTPVDPPDDIKSVGPILSTTRSGTMAAPAGQNAKDAWVSLGRAPFDANGFHVIVSTNQFGAHRAVLIDLAVGALGQERIILPDLMCSGAAGGGDSDTAFVPLRVRGGDLILARQAQRTASALAELDVAVTLLRSGVLPGYRKALTYGAVSADTGGTDLEPGGVAHTKGVWATIGTTAIDARAILVSLGNRLNTAMATALWLFDVAVGPDGQERVIIENVHFGSNSTSDQLSPRHFLFPVSIRAGSRIAMRTQSNIIDATDRLTEAVITVFG